jgi:16S rRNA (cytidine1402-2'-O)-methyltransferase
MDWPLSSLYGKEHIYHKSGLVKRRKCYNSMEKFSLYLVPTPIGNLRDITLRALDVMKAVDLIVCEDTRHTKKLLTHYGISKPLLSCERFSEARKTRYILDQVESGKNIALLSDAGTPAVSDPGSRLVAEARSRGVRVEALPGACALITAFSATGFEPPFRFMGFFPRQKDEREKELARMSATTDVTIFYESPRRLLATLKWIMKYMPDREICVARELTKVHEEYIIGAASEIIPRLAECEIKGELTVLVKGTLIHTTIEQDSLEERMRALINTGHSGRDVLQVLSQETGISRNEIYKMLIHLKKD